MDLLDSKAAFCSYSSISSLILMSSSSWFSSLATLLMSSLNDLSDYFRMKSRKDSPKEIPWRNKLRIIVREIILKFRKLIESFRIDNIETELFIFGDITLLDVLNLQSLYMRIDLLPLYPHSIFL